MNREALSFESRSRIRATRRKVLLAVAVIVLSFQIPTAHWPALGVLLAGLFILQTLAGMPLRVLGRRWLMFLPLLGTLTLSMLIGGTEETRYELAARVFFRGSVAFMASLWLSGVISMTALVECLHYYRFPRTLMGGLVVMHRQIQLLWLEVERMQAARASRGGGRGFFLSRWVQMAQMLGLLVVRCMRRGDQLHEAMLARGYTGGVDWTLPVDAAPAVTNPR